MRIVYCIDEMSHPGGIGRVTSVKANWWVEHGHDVWIATSNQCGKPDFYELNPKVKRKDFAMGFQLGIDNSNLLLKAIRKIGKMKHYRRELEAFVNEVKPDIVVSTFTNDSDFLYKFKDGSKKVLEFHFSHDGFKSQIKYGPKSLKNTLLLNYRLWKHERIARKYDAFVVLTNEDAESWKGYNNLHVIHNMSTIEPMSVSTCEEKRVIAIGRFDFQKQFRRLVEIWNLIAESNPNWKLMIYGQGPEENELQMQIDALGLTQKIELCKPTNKITEVYCHSSILAMTSCYEGWGLVITEAMECGVPAVAYACKCGPRDIIDDGINGFLIDEDDKNGFAEKLQRLITNTDERKSFGSRAKEKSKCFSVDAIMQQWEKLFNHLTCSSGQ